MRLSVDKSDPGYTHLATFCSVLIDGKPVDGVITADEQFGYAIAIRKVRNRIVADKNGSVLTRTIKGDVKIIVPDHLKPFIFGAK